MSFVVSDAILGSGNVLKQVRSSSHRTGAAVRRGRYSGGAVTRQIYGTQMEEVTTLTSGDVAGALAFNSGDFITEGLYISSGSVVVPFKNRANGGLFQAGSNHSSITGANAFIFPTSIEAQSDSEAGASITIETHWLSTTGVAAACTNAASQALAAEAFNVEYACGPVDINGTDIASVTGIQVNTGIVVVKQTANSGAWPVEASIQTVDPVIDVTVHDIDEVIALTDGFTAITGIESYFRKRSDGAQFVSDATEEHIKFTFAGGTIAGETIEGPETGNGSVTVRFAGKVLAVSTTSAIT